jgi:hypothetical protein
MISWFALGKIITASVTSKYLIIPLFIYLKIWMLNTCKFFFTMNQYKKYILFHPHPTPQDTQLPVHTCTQNNNFS